MKAKHLLVLLFIFLMEKSFGQVLAKNQADIGGTGSDQLKKLCTTKDGGILLAGQSNSNNSKFKSQDSRGSYDYWIVKAFRNKITGNIKIQWEKTIGGDSTDNLVKAIQTKDGGYLLGGYSISGKSGEKSQDRVGGYDYWLVKLGENGNIQWDKTIGNTNNTYPYDDYLYDFDQTLDGGYITSGSLGLLKLDRYGNIQWQKPFYYQTIQQLSDGNFISTTGLSIVKSDNAGNIIWEKAYSYPFLIGNFAVKQTSDHGYIYYQAGPTAYNENGGENGFYYDFNIRIIKTDSLGNQQWLYSPSNFFDLNPYSYCTLQETHDKGFIFGACYGYSKSDYYCFKLTSDGQPEWSKVFGGNSTDLLTDILEVNPNRFLIGGYSNSPISNQKTKGSLGIDDYWIVGLTDTTSTTLNIKNNVESNIGITQLKTIAYPNPVKDILHIQNSGAATFTLTNQSGKIILVKKINGNGEINVSHLPAGLYYLKNNKTGEVQKIILTR